MLDALPGADPSAERLSRIADAVLEAEASTTGGSPRIPRRAKVVALPRRWVAAAAAVLLAVAWFAWNGSGPSPQPEPGATESADAPEFLGDPVFVQDFEVIRDLELLDEIGDELVLPDDDALLDVVTLQVLSGA
jgi:hypothetical protein